MGNPNNPAEIAGVDFSDTRPDPVRLAALGFRFAVSYLKPLGPSGPSPREWRPAEIRAYVAAGLGVLAVWETDGESGPRAGAVGGAQDARLAIARAFAVGYPTGAPIFAAADWDVQADQLQTVAEYHLAFHEAVSAAGWPGGAYGSRAVVEAAAAAGVPYLWQTAGWSGGILSPTAHLYQRNRKHWPDVAGTDEDVLCRPIPWAGPGGGAPPNPSPPPPPAPVPAPTPAPVHAARFDVLSWRANEGDAGEVFALLQAWGNEEFRAYCRIEPLAPHYGPQTAAFLRAFAWRAKDDRALPVWVRTRLAGARGDNIAEGLAFALDHYGFTAYLERVGFHA